MHEQPGSRTKGPGLSCSVHQGSCRIVSASDFGRTTKLPDQDMRPWALASSRRGATQPAQLNMCFVLPHGRAQAGPASRKAQHCTMLSADRHEYLGAHHENCQIWKWAPGSCPLWAGSCPACLAQQMACPATRQGSGAPGCPGL